jgi:hypothetical protein
MARKGTHPSATTSKRTRRAIQRSDESDQVLARRFGVNRKTIAKWRARKTVANAPMGPKEMGSSVHDYEREAVIVLYRRRSGLSLDACLKRLRVHMPDLSRSALQRCFKRRGVNRRGKVSKSPFVAIGSHGLCCFEVVYDEITIKISPGIGFAYGIFMAIEATTKDLFYESVPFGDSSSAVQFLERLIAKIPIQIAAVATEVDPIFVDWSGKPGENIAIGSSHPFASACRLHDIEQRIFVENWNHLV